MEVPYLTKYYRNTIVGYSFSKSLSLPGERIGYLVMPDELDGAKDIIAAAAVANRILGYVNAPSLFQRVIAKCLDAKADLEYYNRNRETLYNGLQKAGLTCIKPEGAFYLFVKSPIADEKEFCQKAKEYHLLIVPGSSFACPGYVRLAYCVSYETIVNALPKFEELMKVHDQRIKYLDILNSYVKTPVTKGSIIGMKAHDYFTMGCPDLNTAYNLFKEAVELEKDNADYFVLQEFTDVSGRKVKADETHKEQFIQDYIAAAGYADAAFKKETKAKTKELLKVAKDNIDAFFINSGVATCDNLQSIYAPKVEQNKTNLDYLKQVISVMQMLGCTEQEAYFAASEHAHAIEPTSETAIGCGYMYFKKGDLDKCITYFDQAIELEQDPVKKADYCYKTAAILFNKKQLSKAKQYALKSISLDGSNGKPYILIANMYASSPNWSDENALNKCTYFAVIDKLQRAKSVDSSVEEEANKLIGTYSRYTPKDEDLFFLGLKKGDSVTIGGWIGETTTIR